MNHQKLFFYWVCLILKLYRIFLKLNQNSFKLHAVSRENDQSMILKSKSSKKSKYSFLDNNIFFLFSQFNFLCLGHWEQNSLNLLASTLKLGKTILPFIILFLVNFYGYYALMHNFLFSNTPPSKTGRFSILVAKYNI